MRSPLLIIVGQLIRQTRCVRQQVTYRNLFSEFASKLRQVTHHRIIKAENTSIVQSHQGCDHHRLGNGPQQESCPIGSS
jgi:hypothetical protein